MNYTIRNGLFRHIPWWEYLAIGVTGWITLYSTAIASLSNPSAALVGHAQGVCFAATFLLAGNEARKDRVRSAATPVQPQWSLGMSRERFETLLGLSFQNRGYRIEPVSNPERKAGIGIRMVREGRTCMIHTGLWNALALKPEALGLLEQCRLSAFAHQAMLITLGECSDETRQIAQSLRVVLMDRPVVEALAREFPTLQAQIGPP